MVIDTGSPAFKSLPKSVQKRFISSGEARSGGGDGSPRTPEEEKKVLTRKDLLNFQRQVAARKLGVITRVTRSAKSGTITFFGPRGKFTMPTNAISFTSRDRPGGIQTQEDLVFIRENGKLTAFTPEALEQKLRGQQAERIESLGQRVGRDLQVDRETGEVIERKREEATFFRGAATTRTVGGRQQVVAVPAAGEDADILALSDLDPNEQGEILRESVEDIGFSLNRFNLDQAQQEVENEQRNAGEGNLLDTSRVDPNGLAVDFTPEQEFILRRRAAAEETMQNLPGLKFGIEVGTSFGKEVSKLVTGTAALGQIISGRRLISRPSTVAPLLFRQDVQMVGGGAALMSLPLGLQTVAVGGIATLGISSAVLDPTPERIGQAIFVSTPLPFIGFRGMQFNINRAIARGQMARLNKLISGEPFRPDTTTFVPRDDIVSVDIIGNRLSRIVETETRMRGIPVIERGTGAVLTQRQLQLRPGGVDVLTPFQESPLRSREIGQINDFVGKFVRRPLPPDVSGRITFGRFTESGRFVSSVRAETQTELPLFFRAAERLAVMRRQLPNFDSFRTPRGLRDFFTSERGSLQIPRTVEVQQSLFETSRRRLIEIPEVTRTSRLPTIRQESFAINIPAIRSRVATANLLRERARLLSSVNVLSGIRSISITNVATIQIPAIATAVRTTQVLRQQQRSRLRSAFRLPDFPFPRFPLIIPSRILRIPKIPRLPPPRRPPPLLFPGTPSARRKKKKKKRRRTVGAFSPSLVAVSLNIRGPTPRILTGLETRPIRRRKKKKKRR